MYFITSHLLIAAQCSCLSVLMVCLALNNSKGCLVFTLAEFNLRSVPVAKKTESKKPNNCIQKRFKKEAYSTYLSNIINKCKNNSDTFCFEP